MLTAAVIGWSTTRTLLSLSRMNCCSPSCLVSQMSSAADAAPGMLSNASAPLCPLDSSSSCSSRKTPCKQLMA